MICVINVAPLFGTIYMSVLVFSAFGFLLPNLLCVATLMSFGV